MGCASSRQISQAPQAKSDPKHGPHPHVAFIFPAPDVSAPPAVHKFNPSSMFSHPQYMQDASMSDEYDDPKGSTTSYDPCALPPNEIHGYQGANSYQKTFTWTSTCYLRQLIQRGSCYWKDRKNGPIAPSPRGMTCWLMQSNEAVFQPS